MSDLIRFLFISGKKDSEAFRLLHPESEKTTKPAAIIKKIFFWYIMGKKIMIKKHAQKSISKSGK